MPAYEYKCPNCQTVAQTDTSDPPICGCTPVKMVRVYSFSTTNMPTRAGRRMGKTSTK